MTPTPKRLARLIQPWGLPLEPIVLVVGVVVLGVPAMAVGLGGHLPPGHGANR